MADISPARIIIQQEEAKYRAAVSEALMSRVGAVTNFISMRQYDSRGFFLNGPYSIVGTQTGVDGTWVVLYDVTLIGCAMFNLVAGSSGTTTLDVRRWTATNTGGSSIFSQKPSLASSTGNYAYVARNFDSGTNIEYPAGATLPLLSVSDLDAGDMLTLNKDATQVGGQNCGLILFYRPR